jgi:hypothetical protein
MWRLHAARACFYRRGASWSTLKSVIKKPNSSAVGRERHVARSHAHARKRPKGFHRYDSGGLVRVSVSRDLHRPKFKAVSIREPGDEELTRVELFNIGHERDPQDQ